MTPALVILAVGVALIWAGCAMRSHSDRMGDGGAGAAFLALIFWLVGMILAGVSLLAIAHVLRMKGLM